ncbi:MAG: DUF4403 family protein, partial [Pseudomonadota bacterium]
ASSRGLQVAVPVTYDLALRGRGAARRFREALSGTGTAVFDFGLTLQADGTLSVTEPATRMVAGQEAGAAPDTRAVERSRAGAPVIQLGAQQRSLGDLFARALRQRGRRIGAALRANITADDPTKGLLQAWRTLHYPVQIAQQPPVWLRMTPARLQFAGLTRTGDQLELRHAVTGQLGRYVGTPPVPLIPLEMPQTALLSDDEPLVSKTLMTRRVDYAPAVAAVANALSSKRASEQAGALALRRDAAGVPLGTLDVLGVRAYPVGQRLALAFDVTMTRRDAWLPQSGTVVVTGVPMVDPQTQTIVLSVPRMTQPSNDPALYDGGRFIIEAAPFLEAITANLRFDLGPLLEAARAESRAPLEASWRNGLALEREVDSVEVFAIEPHRGGLQLVLAVTGALTVRAPMETQSFEASTAVAPAQ